MNIPFNKPYITSHEITHIAQVLTKGHISENGHYTDLCSKWFTNCFGFCSTLMTTSCTSALEMAALLSEITPGDEVIMPSFTYVSTALAFAKFGAKICFIDSLHNHPNMDCSLVEKSITPRTKVIVVVHYNGVPCEMDKICALAKKHHIMVVEDAAHATNSAVCGREGDLTTMSFHETKNIHCGEGGLLGINNPQLIERAKKLWIKGTNRLAFEQGMTAKYEWVDTGGAYAMSELSASFLWGQIAGFKSIITRREEQWARYYNQLKETKIELPLACGTSHIFYLLLNSKASRDSLIKYLGKHHIHAPFHYNALHNSHCGKKFNTNMQLLHAERYSECLLRLPLYYELQNDQIDLITDLVKKWILLKKE